jgi:hypothetical protein
LHRSGLTDETIARAGLYSASARALGDILGFSVGSAGFVIPYPSLDGLDASGYCRVKLDIAPADAEGKVRRYRQPKSSVNRLYTALVAPAVLHDVAIPLWVSEGEKKALAGCQAGLACVAFSGVWSWRTKETPDPVRSRPIPDLDAISWAGRRVYLVLDSDRATNPEVLRAERALVAEFRRREAVVAVVPLPPGAGGAKQGLDDYLLTHSVEALCAIEPILPGTDGDLGATPRFRRAAEVAHEPPPATIVDGIAWAGSITTLVSEPGVGKTFLLLDLAAAVSDGRFAWQGRRVCHGSVAYLSYERDALGVRLLGLMERGAPLADLHVIHVPWPLSPRVDRDGTETPSVGEVRVTALLAELAVAVAATDSPPLRLVIIDTVRASLVGSEDSSEPVSAYLRAVARLVARHPDAGVILAHHAGWQDTESPRKRERGSSAWRGNVDATVYVEAGEHNRELGETTLTLTTKKVRDGEVPPPVRVLRRRVTLATQDAFGRPRTTCVIDADPRTRADLDAERVAARAAEERAVDDRALAMIARGEVTGVRMLRILLGVKMDTATATLARLLLAGRVKRPLRAGQPYTVVVGEA